jgi:hypothetical protein
MAKARFLGTERTGTFQAIRAQGLFASALQASESPAPDQIHLAVAKTLRRLGIDGCAAHLAAEFGDHPELAPARMAWALATVNTAYPAPSTDRQPLAVRS